MNVIGTTELIDLVAGATGQSKSATKAVVEATIGAIVARTAAGEKVRLKGLGSFEQRQRAARNGRNPQTGAMIAIPAKAHLAFRAAKATA